MVEDDRGLDQSLRPNREAERKRIEEERRMLERVPELVKAVEKKLAPPGTPQILEMIAENQHLITKHLTQLEEKFLALQQQVDRVIRNMEVIK